MFAFALKELSFDDEYVSTFDIFEDFWEQKGIETGDVPRSVETKIEKAEKIAEQKIDEKQQENYQRILDTEKLELPGLVNECIVWANQHGFRKIAYADVDAFLLKKKIKIHPETRRDLYTTVNLNLRYQRNNCRVTRSRLDFKRLLVNYMVKVWG